jgi:hypothetical protein
MVGPAFSTTVSRDTSDDHESVYGSGGSPGSSFHSSTLKETSAAVTQVVLEKTTKLIPGPRFWVGVSVVADVSMVVGVAVGVGDGVSDGISVGVTVAVSVTVTVGVVVAVGVAVAVCVYVSVGVSVAVAVGVSVGVTTAGGHVEWRHCSA